ncbi:MAG TPA: lipopolysaccharide biosynthesis protein [Terriglobales bacterium]|nr:lipopolysaccharide biosynthesis protein [Terriglobales bacterium]
MDQSLARSLAWRAAGDWFSQIFSWASLLIIVRLLSPADFGIVAMAVVLLPYLRYLGQFGIPRTIITLRDLTDDQLAQLNTVASVLGFACFALAGLLAKPFALLFRTPRLTPVVLVTCIGLIPMGFLSVPEGLLIKEMRFRLISFFDAVYSIVAALTTLVMAFLGWGYWALVCGNLVAALVRTVLVVKARPHGFAMPRLESLRDPLRFGWHVLVSLVALNSYQGLDNAISGRVLGQAALGAYGIAWTLANVPLEKVTSLVTTVVPTYLAAVQKDATQLRRYIRTLTETMALATFPATVGLGLVARELIPIALGRKWEGVIPPLQVLSVYAAFRSIAALLPKVLTAVGNARYVMWNDLVALVILPAAFYAGSHWGNVGIAWGWVAAYPLVALPLYWKTLRTIGMTAGEYFRALRPALDATLVMTLAVGLLKWATPFHLPLLPRLIIDVVSGATAYISTLLLLHRNRMLDIVRLARSIRRSRVQ